MLIGDISDFAIEVMVEPDLKAPSAVWGRMCVHIAGTTLGDFSDLFCALYPAYGHFEWHVKHRDRLWDTIFNDMSPEEIHDTVQDAIYGDDDRTMDRILSDARRYGAFDFLTNWGEQFDGYSSVIVSPNPDTIMVLHRPYINADSPRRIPKDFVDARCSRSGFINASRSFLDWFNRESERLQRKET